MTNLIISPRDNHFSVFLSVVRVYNSYYTGCAHPARPYPKITRSYILGPRSH